MSITRSDLLALLLAIGAGMAGVVVWANGTVTLGMTLRFDGQFVRVADVSPDGNAHRAGIYPGTAVIDLTTTDGSEVRRGEPLSKTLGGMLEQYGDEPLFWEEVFSSRGGELVSYGLDHRPPIEAISSAQIQTIVSGELDPECCVSLYAALDRSYVEFRLQQSIWAGAVGLLLAVLVWRLLAHGIGGDVGRRHGLVVGAAVAIPFLILPAVQVGTTAGIAAGYLLPAGAALILGLGLARRSPDPQWAQTASAASAVAAGLAAVIVVRYLTAPALGSQEGTMIVILIATIGFVPGLIGATGGGRPYRERAALVTMGLMPAASATILTGPSVDPSLPVILLGLLTGVQLMPAGGAFNLLRTGMRRVLGRKRRSQGQTPPASLPAPDPSIVATRDLLTYGLIGTSILLSLAMPEPFDVPSGGWAAVIGVGLAALVGFGIRRGFLGAGWTDAAVPLAAAVSVPVMLSGGLSYYSRTPFALIPTALAALSVAHVLATRHPDREWRTRLFIASAGLVAFTAFLGIVGLESIGVPLTGMVAIIPGMVAFADEVGEPRALTSRLETLAVAITPGISVTMLIPGVGLYIVGAWLVAIVVWRQFTLNPLLGMAERTQVQRDVAVAAAETERARLAADLHDDALQQLTMLVRTLDDSGQKEAADEAREIATKLRSVVGDLRLPILDDLGAGAALEWLVERVEPLAGGPVKLERSDETRPPANVELAVFRVAQEALTNAIKHGKPPIAVRYDVRTDGRVTLAIDDAGEGIGSEAADEAPKEGHFGLVNMQQRAEQIGALLDVRRWPAGGTRVALEWRPQ